MVWSSLAIISRSRRKMKFLSTSVRIVFLISLIADVIYDVIAYCVPVAF